MPNNRNTNRVPIFNDTALQKQFELNGYVIIPLLNEAEITVLKNAYEAADFNHPPNFYSTSFSENKDLKNKLNSGIDSIINDKAKSIFTPFKQLGSCYLSKAPGPNSNLPIHQDWTVVDESKFDSITVWIPLQDVDKNNGALAVVPGSHRFSDALRSPSLTNPLLNLEKEINNDLQLIPLKAGEAIIFSQALIHASPPNTTNNIRLAVTYGIIPEQAELLFYYKNSKTNRVEKHAVPVNFFEQYNTKIGETPNMGILLNEFEYAENTLSANEYYLQKRIHQIHKNKYIKMQSIFKNTEHQSFFEKEGYLIIPTLGVDDIKELYDYYQSLQIKDEKGFGFHVSMDQLDKTLCAEIRAKIWNTVLPKLDPFVENHKTFVASYVVKESNPKGVVPAHQDWSFVDKEEEGFCSITCWTALVDTTLDNGCMGVIKGSNNFMQNQRPSPSPQAPVPLSDHMFSIFPYLKTLEMKAGETLFFDNRTFHASPPNTTPNIRLAVGVGITQKNATLVHYYLKPDGNKNTILKYKVDEDFYLKYDNSRLAKMYEAGEIITDYEVIAELPYQCEQFTSETLIDLIKNAGNDYNIPMCEKLAELFNYDMTGNKKEETTTQELVVEQQIVEEQETPWVDNRTFFKKYTPINILREIKFKVTGKR